MLPTNLLIFYLMSSTQPDYLSFVWRVSGGRESVCDRQLSTEWDGFGSSRKKKSKKNPELLSGLIPVLKKDPLFKTSKRLSKITRNSVPVKISPEIIFSKGDRRQKLIASRYFARFFAHWPLRKTILPHRKKSLC